MVTPQVPCMNPSINILLFDLPAFYSPQNCSSFFLTLFLTQDATGPYRVAAWGGRRCFSLQYCKTLMEGGHILARSKGQREGPQCPQLSHAPVSQLLLLSLTLLGYFACCESLNKMLVSLAVAARVRAGTLLRFLRTSRPRA